MTKIKLRSDFDVDLVQWAGDDEFICKAARVSTLGAASIDSKESEGLLMFLMRNRHGSPFEHGLMTFRITGPIFMWREFMRHRIGFSYNEESGRYKILDGVFYLPSARRKLIQVGKPGEYEFREGTAEHYDIMRENKIKSYKRAWKSYNIQLTAGIAKEVARMDLPVATYSTAYVTCNPRSLMSFLGLRTYGNLSSHFKSTPQWEISDVADKMEAHFAKLYPITQAIFDRNGRVAP